MSVGKGDAPLERVAEGLAQALLCGGERVGVGVEPEQPPVGRGGFEQGERVASATERAIRPARARPERQALYHLL